MPDATVASLQEWLRAHEAELLSDYRTLLRFPSIEADPLPNAPFGQANRDALDFVLQLGQGWGMATKDLEGYAGYAEFGSGTPLVMTLGHLDVVPVGPGWSHEPFGAELVDGYVYARGAVDDKGPTIASFYACRALQAVVGDPGVRVRAVFGCNEESGFRCVERYNQTEEAPTFGVAPDSGWPLYHGEKGIANLFVESPLPAGEVELLSVEGGQRGNIVIDSCRALARVTPAARPHVEAKVAGHWDRNVRARWDADTLHIEATGKAAHGSMPHLGDNAAARVFRFLREVAPANDQAAFERLLSFTHIGGEGLGIAGSDPESGPLTNNVGVVATTEGRVRMQCNVRYPVTWAGEGLRARCEAHLDDLGEGDRLARFDDSPPLYFPIDHPLVATVCDVYEEETGERGKPRTMGGGTYARAVANTVSIGTGWAGDGDAHETDERCAVESLFKMSRIYAHILYRLAQLAAERT